MGKSRCLQPAKPYCPNKDGGHYLAARLRSATDGWETNDIKWITLALFEVFWNTFLLKWELQCSWKDTKKANTSGGNMLLTRQRRCGPAQIGGRCCSGTCCRLQEWNLPGGWSHSAADNSNNVTYIRTVRTNYEAAGGVVCRDTVEDLKIYSLCSFTIDPLDPLCYEILLSVLFRIGNWIFVFLLF